jgi:Skp family chaperone for outer membrane proteins
MWNFVMARVVGGAMLVAFALGAAIATAGAQPAAPAAVVVVVVDMTQIMREAKAAKDIQAQIEGAMNAYSGEVAKQEGGLKELRDELERQRTVLAPEVFNAKSQEYQQRYAALDRDVQTKRQEMQQTYSEAMTKVETAALQIVADVAKERKANMVVAKAALLYMDDAFDVTPEVTRRLDEKFPSMPVSVPKAGGEIAAKPNAAPPAATK